MTLFWKNSIFLKICSELRKKLKWPARKRICNTRLHELVSIRGVTDHIRLVLLFISATRGIAYEGAQWKRDPLKPENNTIYIIYGSNHYMGVLWPRLFYSSIPDGPYNDNYHWCHSCLILYHREHECQALLDDDDNDDGHIPKPKGKKTKYDKCTKCRKPNNPNHKCKVCPTCDELLFHGHLCHHVFCTWCRTYIPFNGNSPFEIRTQHQCPVYVPMKPCDTKSFEDEPPRIHFDNDEWGYKDTGYNALEAIEDNTFNDNGEPELDTSKTWTVLAYDLECMMTHEKEVIDLKRQLEFSRKVTVLHRKRRDENTYRDRLIHKPNLAVARNVFNPEEELEFRTIPDFIRQLLAVPKNYICIAHNAAGYDSRLVFADLIKMKGKPKKIIRRGTKIIYMQYENIVFLDSMMHLLGSLARLGKDFNLDKNLLKGHFPHKLNRDGVPNILPSIPPLEEYVDLRFISSQEDLDELKQWYAEQPKNVRWCRDDELVKYCKQDVQVLAEILLAYHNDIVKITGISPLGIPTSAGLSHRMFLKKYLADHVETLESCNMINNRLCCERNHENEKLAKKMNRCLSYDVSQTWAVLTKGEYFFARDALRGGRTDIRRTYLSLTDEQIARGEEIRYIDIVSMYPTVQIRHDYPVGIPKVFLYQDRNCPDKQACARYLRKEITGKDRRYSTINISFSQPSMDYLQSFFGFIMADLTPPKNLFHPVLVRYDKKKNKSVASLEKIVQSENFQQGQRSVFTSVEFQLALRNGYHVDHVYCIHEYNKKPSLWKDYLCRLAALKIENSGLPDRYTEEEYKEAYKQKYGIILGKIGNNKCKKATYKTPLNSAWGKCCENPNHEHTDIVSSNSCREIMELELKEQTDLIDISGVSHLSENYTLVKYKDNFKVAPLKTDTTYIPAGVFVPAYGRVMLWEAMNNLGDRVLMHDTDR